MEREVKKEIERLGEGVKGRRREWDRGCQLVNSTRFHFNNRKLIMLEILP